MSRAPALILAFALAAAPVSAQQSEPPPPLSLEAPSAPDIISEGARRILEGIRRLVDQMPMFEPPRVTPEGDIILKRIRPTFPEGEEARTGGQPAHEGLEL
ncbi:MAG: hypothetical protein FJX54_02945 [Alphaproteobacteria bacterium]|nr:hypothetical protein [Alphaproteobacteria bacterium]